MVTQGVSAGQGFDELKVRNEGIEPRNESLDKYPLLLPKVYIETPVHGGFHHATCILPAYRWVDISGYSEEEIEDYTDFLHHNAHLILEFAAEGFLNAAPV